MKSPLFTIKIWIKSFPGWLYRLFLPLLVNPPRVVYRGNLYTIPRENIIRFLDEWKSQIHGKVLDVGVGTWQLPRQLLKDRCDYVATDCFEDPNIDVMSDIHALSQTFEQNSFDFVLCTDVIEHVERPWMAVRQLYAVLKPGGTLLLTTPFNFHLHGNGTFKDYWRVSADGLRFLLLEEAGFKDVHITALGHPNFPFSHLVVAIK